MRDQILASTKKRNAKINRLRKLSIDVKIEKLNKAQDAGRAYRERKPVLCGRWRVLPAGVRLAATRPARSC